MTTFETLPAPPLGWGAPVRTWQVRSSAPGGQVTAETGAVVSLPAYDAAGWLVAPARSTVLAALIANGRYPDLHFSENLELLVDKDEFSVPWWYRTVFDGVVTGQAAGRDQHTFLRLEGVIHKANVFLNGEQVASTEEVSGAYVTTELDISALTRQGNNALALEVMPGSPLTDFSIGWVDWNLWPPDNNMGVWRDAVVERTGSLRISSLQVSSEPQADGAADVELSLILENLGAGASDAVLHVTMGRETEGVRFDEAIELQKGGNRVLLSPEQVPELRIDRPQLWWPHGEGPQPLYDLEVSLTDGSGRLSHQARRRFGIRSVGTTIEPGGGRRFFLNGRALQVLGGGWAPDIFLRHDAERMRRELTLAKHIGLNCVRLEGKLENSEFYDIADELGLMVLPGWECCNKWEGEKGDQGADWVESDYDIAASSMRSEAVRLRDRASVVGFLIGSDFAPPERTAEIYVRELERAGWRLPVISAATVEGTEAAGPSGMKMTGPYDWVPPVYWYTTDPRFGGAVGFNSEAGTGHNLPRLESLRRMLSEDDLERLWREPHAKQVHSGPPSEFDNLAVFHEALAGRYGPPSSLEDFVRKAQLAGYEATRAQFEAYVSRAWAERPATGLVYWMLNSAWPSLNWQLYDWYLDAAGAYFGAKKALEMHHVMYAYDTGEILVVNRSAEPAGPFGIRAALYDLRGRPVLDERWCTDAVDGRRVLPVGQVALPGGPAATYLLALDLTDKEAAAVSRNVYWLSSVPDELDFENTSWRYTPTSRYADLTQLATMPSTALEGHVSTTVSAGRLHSTVVIKNGSPEGTPAVGVHASVEGSGWAALWDDNDITLLGGEEAVLRCDSPAAGRTSAAVSLEAFNVARIVFT